jgi:NADH-quinone oxidoreductase subunit J
LITFWILAVLIVASAVFVVSASRPVYSVLGLLLNFLLLAMMYLTLDAEFLAVIQVVVYSGAILMLFLFVIALLSSGVRQFSVGPNRLPRILAPLSVFGALALGGLLFVIVQSVTPSLPQSTAASAAGNANVFGSVADFGQALFTTYLLPFEATAFVLMIAVIGVIALAGDVDPPRPPRRKPLRKREPILKERS